MQVLGLFAKQPIRGDVKSRLARDIGPEAALAFYEACLADLTQRFATTGEARWLGFAPATAAAETWFRTFVAGRYQIWPQPDGDLGHRIEAFFTAALATPQNRAVLIGSDSPQLSTDRVAAAFAALEHADLVLGPAADGGYDLIGLRRCPGDWLNGVRWSTAWTLADTIAAAVRSHLSLVLLPLGSDVDTVEDLAALWGQMQAQRVIEPARLRSLTEDWLTAWVAKSDHGRRDL